MHLAIANDGMTLAAHGEDDRIAVWDRRYVSSWWGLAMPDAIAALDFSPTDLLAIGLRDGQVVIRNVREDRDRARFQAHASAIHSLAFSPDGRTLATGGVVETDGSRPDLECRGAPERSEAPTETSGKGRSSDRPGRAAERAQEARPVVAFVDRGGSRTGVPRWASTFLGEGERAGCSWASPAPAPPG